LKKVFYIYLFQKVEVKDSNLTTHTERKTVKNPKSFSANHYNTKKNSIHITQNRSPRQSQSNLAKAYKLHTTRGSQAPKSIDYFRNKSRIVNTFVNGEGFGFNYYLNNTNEKNTDGGEKTLPNEKETKRDTANDLQNILNEEIDKLLKHYLKEINNSKLIIFL